MAENSQNRLPRLLALVPWLLQRPGITLAETASHFGISTDQLTTDLYQLVVCGVPGYGPDQLVDIDFYDGERIWVTDPQTLNVPMRLTADELMAHSMALRFLYQLPGTSTKEEIGVLAAKLDRAASDLGASSTRSLLDVGACIDPEIEEIIATSLTTRVKISFEYASADNSLTQRVVSPQRVFRVDDYVYLEALCDQAEAIRVFRLDRMVTCSLTEHTASEVTDSALGGEPSSAEPYVFASFRDSPKATLRLSESARWLAEEAWVEVDPDDPLVIRVPYLSPEWLYRWVLSHGADVALLDPSETVDRISHTIRDALSRLQVHG